MNDKTNRYQWFPGQLQQYLWVWLLYFPVHMAAFQMSFISEVLIKQRLCLSLDTKGIVSNKNRANSLVSLFTSITIISRSVFFIFTGNS